MEIKMIITSYFNDSVYSDLKLKQKDEEYKMGDAKR